MFCTNVMQGATNSQKRLRRFLRHIGPCVDLLDHAQSVVREDHRGIDHAHDYDTSTCLVDQPKTISSCDDNIGVSHVL